MGHAAVIRRRTQGHAVAQRLVILVNDILDLGDVGAGDHDALDRAAAQNRLHDPHAVGGLDGSCLDGQTVGQRAGDVLVAVHGLEHVLVHRLDQHKAKGVVFGGLVIQHLVAAPRGDAVTLGEFELVRPSSLI